MRATVTSWLQGFLMPASAAPRRERLRAACGACLGLFFTAVLTHLFAPGLSGYLIAPMGASAVLLFCVPASPLAQPWAVVGGNTVSALIGVACARWVPNLALAAALAGSLAVAAMFALRCLHPPGGASALTAVLGGPLVHAAGFEFALLPVAVNSLLIVTVALLYNNATGHRFPHVQRAPVKPLAAPPGPEITGADLDAALLRYGEVLDVSRADLLAILDDARQQALRRHLRQT